MFVAGKLSRQASPERCGDVQRQKEKRLQRVDLVQILFSRATHWAQYRSSNSLSHLKKSSNKLLCERGMLSSIMCEGQ